MISAIPEDTKKKTKQSSQNTSEPQKTDEEINESSEKFRLLFENSVDAIFVADAETKMLTDCNKSAEKLVGRSKEEIITLGADALHPKDKVKETMEAFKRQAEGKIEYVGTEVLTKGGERIPVEINSSLFVFRGKTYLLGIFRDVSERRKVEEALRASEAKYRLLVENLPQKIFLKDRNSVYISCNENYARDLKIKAEEIKGKTDYDFYPKELAEKYRADDKKIMEKGEIAEIEENYIQDGKDFFVHTVKTPTRDEQGSVIGTLGIFWDITERKKIEEKIKVFSDAIAGASDYFLLTDLQGNITYANESAISAFGYTPEEFLGLNTAKLDADPETGKKVIQDLMAKGKWSGEVMNIRKNKEKFPSILSAFIIKDEEGNPKGMMGIIKDITERKKTETLVKTSEEKYRSLVQNIPDVVWTSDQNGKTAFISSNVKKIYGYTPEEIIDGGDEVWFGRIHPDDIEIMKKFYTALFEKKDLFDVEYRIKRKDGKWIWLHDRAITVYEKNGIKYADGVFSDITTLKQAEIELRAEKAKLEKYFDIIGIIVMVLGIKGEILLLNKKGCEILGYQPNEVIGKNWITDFLSKNKKAKPGNFLGGLLKDGTDNAYFEHSVFTKDGKEKNITWGSIPIRDEAGNVQAFLCAGEDVTILRQAEVTITQLKEFDRLKDEFLNIAAHELKTPLTSIIGLSEIIKTQKACLPSQMVEYPDIIYNEGQRLGRVVRRILTITRYESGKEVIHPEPINLTAFISSLLPGLNILTKDKKVAIATNLKEENLQIESDKEMISEVIINLVDNSIKYGPENQTITVSACRIDGGIDKGMVRIEVADQGPGIPPDSIKKLFNKFWQLEPSLSRSQEGTGLGLYICKLIIEKLGGKIGVKSELNKGSTFYFTIPIKNAVIQKRDFDFKAV